ncbi:uncharacterized protein [Ptychodera flava]|uniref:uncharacterized protein n=1 Tax=Ptychodera flava TaxID=63121 RepID=UPI00396A0BE6
MKFQAVTIVGVVLLSVIDCHARSQSRPCADDGWYYEVRTFRCKPCTVCVEELGEREESPCQDFKDTVCTATPVVTRPPPTERAKVEIPSKLLKKSPTDSVTDREAVTSDLGEFRTFLPFDPEAGESATDIDQEVEAEELRIPCEDTTDQLNKWKVICYVLAGIVIALVTIVIVLIAYICCVQYPVKHVSFSDAEKAQGMEDSVFLETDNNGYTIRRPRLFSRQRLSTTEFLRSLNCKDTKPLGSKEELFDKVTLSDSTAAAYTESKFTKDSDVTIETSINEHERTTVIC